MILDGECLTLKRFLLMIGVVCTSVPTYVDAHRGIGRGLHPLDWHTEQIFSVMAGGFYNGPAGETKYIGDRHCMSAGGLNVNILNDFAFDIDETVEVEIEFDLKSTPREVNMWADVNAPESSTELSSILLAPFQKILLPVYSEGQRFFKRSMKLERARFAGLGRFGTDIYLGLPITADEGTQITVCNIKLKRSYETKEPEHYGRLALNIVDEHGAQVPVRIGLYEQSGRMPLPSNEAVIVKWREDTRRVLDLLPVSSGTWPHKFKGGRIALFLTTLKTCSNKKRYGPFQSDPFNLSKKISRTH